MRFTCFRLNLVNCNQTVTRVFTPVVLMVGFIAGCDSYKNQYTQLEAYIETVNHRPPTPIEPLPTFKAYQAFYFDATNLRDPFAPLESKAGGNSDLAPDKNRPKQELETFPLDSLKMVGTLLQNNKMWALVAAPNKMVYRIQVGQYMGQNYGEVMHIANDKIDILETISDGLGGWKKHKTFLALS